MKPIRQSEAAECGLACLAMIANHHGAKYDLLALRRKFAISIKGATLKSVIQIADRLGFSARPVRIELDALPSMEMPAILHWNFNHFVVLEKATGRHATILDPARGRIKLKLEDVSKHFTGVALELIPTPQFKKTEEIKPVKLGDFWSRIKGLKGNMAQAFALSFFLQLFALATPLYQQMVVDDAITREDSNFLLVLALGFGLMGLFNIAITHLRSFVMLHFTTALSFQMKTNLMRHLIRLPLEFFEKRHVGDITSRFNSLDPIEDLFTNGIVSVILDSLMAIGTLAMALMYSWKLTAIAVGFLLFDFLIDLALYPIRRRMNEDIIVTGAKEETSFLETIRAARSIKIFGKEHARETIWQNAQADTVNAELKLAKFDIYIGSIGGVISTIQTILLLYVGAHLVIDGALTLGMLFAYQSYSGQFSSRFSSLLDQVIELKMLGLHLSRLADIVHTKPEIQPATNFNPLNLLDDHSSAEQPTLVAQTNLKLDGKVTVKDLSFRYGEQEPWVLDNVNFQINPGEMVALVGPSGAGKTTLLKLLIGLLSANKGEILFDDQALLRHDISAYRSNLGVVMQDDQLLSGTIADNISFFDADIDMKRIEHAAAQAQLHDDIDAFPMKYYSLVGDMGTSLSGGQQQRLLIARALYQNPHLLYLDEGTANLDEYTEQKIADMVQNMPITRIVIAHRPALIERADRILLVENQQVVEILPEDIFEATA